MSVTVHDAQPGVRHIVIDRPTKKNALDSATYSALTRALREADADGTVRAIVLSGAGGNFSSGNDLADFLAAPNIDPAVGLLRALATIDTPLVAAVDGFAVGIGTTILLHCDLAVASRSATFALPFVPLGLTPEGGSSVLLPEIAGTKLANELLLLGDRFDVDIAQRAGIINRIVDADDAVPAAIELATRLA
ncbi:MAG TPA: enoyl-CoA hydratase-related protein, partial [Terrimesophilobacter sp.]|nr:enoyl-CoA hydratase-related protein [Terrimesophilobacter sp.]